LPDKEIMRYLFPITIYCFFVSATGFASFEDLGAGARAVGMGNAFTAVADDVNAMYYNPAGLAGLQIKEVQSSYVNLYQGLSDGSKMYEGSLGYANPIDKIGTFGINWQGRQMADFYKEDTIGIGYAKKISRFQVGLNLKLRQKSFSDNLWISANPVFGSLRQKSVYSYDLGLLYRLNAKINFGIFAADLNEPDAGLFSESKIPVLFRAGAAYSNNERKEFTAGMDLVSRENENRLQFGFEKWFFSRSFALRAGGGIGSSGYVEMDTGLGYRFFAGLPLQIDYAFVYPLSGLENIYTQRFALKMQFGSIEKTKAQQEKYFAEGLQDYESGNYSEAIEKFNDYLYLNPADMKARLLKARAGIELGILKKNKKAEEAKLEKKYKELYKIAKTAAKNKEYLKAVDYFSQIVESAPGKMGIVRRSAGNIENIKKNFTQHYAEGFSYWAKTDYKKAAEEWSLLLAVDPGNKEVREYIDKANAKLKEKELLEQTERERKNKFDACFNKGVESYEKKQYSLAVEKFEEAVILNPGDKIVAEYLGKAKAKQTVQKIEEDERSVREYYNNGVKYFNQGGYYDALFEFMGVLEIDPAHKAVRDYIAKIRAKIRSGKILQETVTPQGDTVDISSSNVEKLYNLGLLEYSEGNLEKAVSVWQKVLRFSPEHKKAKINLNRVEKELNTRK